MRKPTAKRGLMGEDFRCHNGARPLVSQDKKARAKRRRLTPADKRELLD